MTIIEQGVQYLATSLWNQRFLLSSYERNCKYKLVNSSLVDAYSFILPDKIVFTHVGGGVYKHFDKLWFAVTM